MVITLPHSLTDEIRSPWLSTVQTGANWGRLVKKLGGLVGLLRRHAPPGGSGFAGSCGRGLQGQAGQPQERPAPSPRLIL